MNKMLSQEEINTLLKDTEDLNQENSVQNELDTEGALNSMEKDVLGELTNITLGSAATTLSSLLGKKVEITVPTMSVVTLEKLLEEYPESCVTLEVEYKTGLKGSKLFLISTYDVGVIVDLIMGGDGSNPPLELSDLHLSAISEAVSQMMSTATNAFSQIFDKQIETSAPELNITNLQEENFFTKEDRESVVISFQFKIEGLLDSKLLQILPASFAKTIVAEILAKNNFNKVPHDYTKVPSKQIEVSSVRFPTFQEETSQKKLAANLDLIMDIGLQLSVELGRTNKKIKEILELTNGSIIELDKLAGEPVDILVNGRILAQGEVVVIDENFGVRVTGIASPAERVKNLK